jgi:hypothetical protein
VPRGPSDAGGTPSPEATAHAGGGLHPPRAARRGRVGGAGQRTGSTGWIRGPWEPGRGRDWAAGQARLAMGREPWVSAILLCAV